MSAKIIDLAEERAKRDAINEQRDALIFDDNYQVEELELEEALLLLDTLNNFVTGENDE